MSFLTAVELKSKSEEISLCHLLGNDFLVWVRVLVWQLSYLCLKTPTAERYTSVPGCVSRMWKEYFLCVCVAFNSGTL